MMQNDSDNNYSLINNESNQEIFNVIENLNHDIYANIDKAIKEKNDKDQKSLEETKNSTILNITDTKDKKSAINKNRTSLNVLYKEIDNLKVFKDEMNINDNSNSKTDKPKKEKIIRKSPKNERFVMFDDLIGEGQFKKVYRAYDSQEGKEVAWNIITLNILKDEEIKNIEHEISTLKKLKHERILNYISGWYDEDNNEVVFITELFSGGSLRSYLNKIGYPRLVVIKQWIIEILEGLKYLHECDIIHRDIKCDNIFINGNTGHIKIGDLGYCCMLENHKKFATTLLGTPEFMAPEVLLGNYSSLADIYSLGLCLIELCTLETPYKECSNVVEIFKNISDGKLPKVIDKIKSVELKNFIIRCLHDISIRPSAETLLETEFLKETEREENKHSVIDYIPPYSNSMHKLNKRNEEKKNNKQNNKQLVSECTNESDAMKSSENSCYKAPFSKSKCKANNVLNIQNTNKNKDDFSNKDISDDNKSTNTIKLDSMKINSNIGLNNNTNMEMFKKQEMDMNDDSTSFYLRPSLQSINNKDDNFNSFRTNIFDKSNSFENIILEKNVNAAEIENNIFHKNMIFTNDFSEIEKSSTTIHNNYNNICVPLSFLTKKEIINNQEIFDKIKHSHKEEIKLYKNLSNDDLCGVNLQNNNVSKFKSVQNNNNNDLSIIKHLENRCNKCNSFLSIHCNSCYKLNNERNSLNFLSTECTYFSIINTKNQDIYNGVSNDNNKLNNVNVVDISNGNINNIESNLNSNAININDISINMNIEQTFNYERNLNSNIDLDRNLALPNQEILLDKLTLINNNMGKCVVTLAQRVTKNSVEEEIYDFNVIIKNRKIEFSIDLDKETVDEVIDEMKEYNLLENLENEETDEYSNVKVQITRILNDYKMVNNYSNEFIRFFEESDKFILFTEDIINFINENKKISQYEFDIMKNIRDFNRLLNIEDYQNKSRKLIESLKKLKDSV